MQFVLKSSVSVFELSMYRTKILSVSLDRQVMSKQGSFYLSEIGLMSIRNKLEKKEGVQSSISMSFVIIFATKWNVY